MWAIFLFGAVIGAHLYAFLFVPASVVSAVLVSRSCGWIPTLLAWLAVGLFSVAPLLSLLLVLPLNLDLFGYESSHPPIFAPARGIAVAVLVAELLVLFWLAVAYGIRLRSFPPAREA